MASPLHAHGELFLLYRYFGLIASDEGGPPFLATRTTGPFFIVRNKYSDMETTEL